jgi:Ribbon-helix-helix protein, copG family
MTTITCKISEKLNAHLEALARRRRVSKSAILRQALEKQVSGRSAAPSAYDLVKHLCGALRGPKDLSTNPRHMRGFGEQHHR